MLALAPRMMASAADSRVRPNDLATSSTAAAASAGSSVILPPARLEPSRPSTTLASVLVACRLPLPYQAGPGLAPADCGPLRSEPASSVQASEPPPAPMVRTSIEEKRIGEPNSTQQTIVT